MYRTLQNLVDRALPGGESDWSYERIREVTFLDGIINETLRLKPALMTGYYRVTPPNGIQVDEVHIPGDTNVFVPVQLIQRDPRYWPKPLEFIPERWSEQKGQLSTENAPFIPFSLGLWLQPSTDMVSADPCNRSLWLSR